MCLIIYFSQTYVQLFGKTGSRRTGGAVRLAVSELKFLDEVYLMWVLNTRKVSRVNLIFPFILRNHLMVVFEINQVNSWVYEAYLCWHVLCFRHLKFLSLRKLQGNIFYATGVCLLSSEVQGFVLNHTTQHHFSRLKSGNADHVLLLQGRGSRLAELEGGWTPVPWPWRKSGKRDFSSWEGPMGSLRSCRT